MSRGGNKTLYVGAHDQRLWECADLVAFVQGTSVSQLVAQALGEYFDKRPELVALGEQIEQVRNGLPR